MVWYYLLYFLNILYFAFSSFVGDVSLQGLKLRRDALEDLQLPIEVVEGTSSLFVMPSYFDVVRRLSWRVYDEDPMASP